MEPLFNLVYLCAAERGFAVDIGSATGRQEDAQIRAERIAFSFQDVKCLRILLII